MTLSSKTAPIPTMDVKSKEIIEEDENFLKFFNKQLIRLFYDAFRFSLKSPSYAYFLLKTLQYQKKAQKVRSKWKEQQLHVPAFLIFSVTGKCNLQCKGCYSHAQHRNKEAELSSQKLRDIIAEAKDLGISIILFAGGEPFIRPELLDITAQFPEIIFPIFTNGLLINDIMIQKLKKQKNVIPVLSIEGGYEETDLRRGTGVFGKVQNVMQKLFQARIFFGTSITLTTSNFSIVTQTTFIQSIIDHGCKLFFYIDYVPVKERTEHLMLTEEQASQISLLTDHFKKQFSQLFVAFPGDEEKLGGCLSAGRGFLHISPEGRIEPCPFAPYSDTNLQDVSLKEALQSKFLAQIRQNHDELMETRGGCALWEKQEWVKTLLHK
ncbi:radical SAM protein [Promethearchaeum syntrophicum]|uniref:Radical SAM protein n=1 Tax=Promethearchaeum syntrophicum TaxID=2594042 RepID=A0A5B9DDE3_9ARCH|nr:radical SAM protein [Candidatus Prometheoarchaeum syntrophicum]QEE16773.1 pyrroloquinoline quinone biosynthesis protein PqqE [Candidatus Prometheoarchaeum syntrophicum]